MHQTDLSTVQGRLRWAIDKQPWQGRRRGLRLFQWGMAKTLEGVALSSIQTYLSGKTAPSLAFLREAARLLDVREPWLILNLGEPTHEDEESVSQEVGTPPGIASAMEGLMEGLVQEFPAFWRLPDATRALVRRIAARACANIAFRAKTGTPVSILEMGSTVGSYLSAPFAILGIDPDSFDSPTLAVMVEGLARPIEFGMPHHPLSDILSGTILFGERQEVGPEGLVLRGAEETP